MKSSNVYKNPHFLMDLHQSFRVNAGQAKPSLSGLGKCRGNVNYLWSHTPAVGQCLARPPQTLFIRPADASEGLWSPLRPLGNIKSPEYCQIAKISSFVPNNLAPWWLISKVNDSSCRDRPKARFCQVSSKLVIVQGNICTKN